MRINSEELSEYIQAVLRGVNDGLSKQIISEGEPESFYLSSPVKFQIGISNSKEIGGEAKIFVVGLHGEKENKEHARIEFEASDSGTNFVEGIDRLVTIWEKLSLKERESIWNTFIQSFVKDNPELVNSLLQPKVDTNKIQGEQPKT